ncbi:MAG: hypothetical protein ACI9DC_000584 [Gammaproteobacteria bacterium]|jgi:hypothetical protein
MEIVDVTAEVAEPVQKRTRARFVLAGLFALFFVPIFGAVIVAVVAPHWIPFGQVNQGELLRPAVADALRTMIPLDGGEAFTRGPFQPWVVAHLGHASCDEACEHALVQMRQARLALGKDAHRVERWWLVAEPPDTSTLTRVMRTFTGLRIGLLQERSPILTHAASPAAIFIVDPMGFLVLKYANTVSEGLAVPTPEKTPAAAPGLDLANALRKDFKRLLKLSRER